MLLFAHGVGVVPIDPKIIHLDSEAGLLHTLDAAMVEKSDSIGQTVLKHSSNRIESWIGKSHCTYHVVPLFQPENNANEPMLQPCSSSVFISDPYRDHLEPCWQRQESHGYVRRYKRIFVSAGVAL